MQTRITKKWHDQHEIAWQELVFYAPPTSYLEIGSYEGASAIWMAKNNKRIRSITCIDNWSNNDEHSDTDMIQVEVNFRHNIKLLEQEYKNISFDVYKMSSHRGLAHLMGKTLMYDWIYIDGSHRARDVLTDLTMAWHLLHPTGIMILDDYLWPNTDAKQAPRLAIDSWMEIHDDYTTWPQTGYQMIIQKN
jgi:predicted O-methyltransferase YrrM